MSSAAEADTSNVSDDVAEEPSSSRAPSSKRSKTPEEETVTVTDSQGNKKTYPTRCDCNPPETCTRAGGPVRYRFKCGHVFRILCLERAIEAAPLVFPLYDGKKSLAAKAKAKAKEAATDDTQTKKVAKKRKGEHDTHIPMEKEVIRSMGPRKNLQSLPPGRRAGAPRTPAKNPPPPGRKTRSKKGNDAASPPNEASEAEPESEEESRKKTPPPPKPPRDPSDFWTRPTKKPETLVLANGRKPGEEKRDNRYWRLPCGDLTTWDEVWTAMRSEPDPDAAKKDALARKAHASKRKVKAAAKGDDTTETGTPKPLTAYMKRKMRLQAKKLAEAAGEAGEEEPAEDGTPTKKGAGGGSSTAAPAKSKRKTAANNTATPKRRKAAKGKGKATEGEATEGAESTAPAKPLSYYMKRKLRAQAEAAAKQAAGDEGEATEAAESTAPAKPLSYYMKRKLKAQAEAAAKQAADAEEEAAEEEEDDPKNKQSDFEVEPTVRKKSAVKKKAVSSLIDSESEFESDEEDTYSQPSPAKYVKNVNDSGDLSDLEEEIAANEIAAKKQKRTSQSYSEFEYDEEASFMDDEEDSFMALPNDEEDSSMALPKAKKGKEPAKNSFDKSMTKTIKKSS
ncbi:hypothetical protein FN846DRAFT_983486 [Sphaerosporella brunnea]|uniref:Uncharacterized protein n=1 Tax=Sphaerosporella brunnea TaxID=1250544 RepID=A0A5J5FCA9_9PEZI|nr:hypothetical protein FN846DRAFT_983486 [Sphaerosporella brunnea]